MDVVITVEKVRAANAGRRSGTPNMYWPHIWWLSHAVKRGVDCNERWLFAALIIPCVDRSVAESILPVHRYYRDHTEYRICLGLPPVQLSKYTYSASS
jgi:hypothetical protein